MELLSLNENDVARKLEKFLSDRLKASGLSGYVIGLSGGVDSSLSASIAVKAVSAEKVTGFIMPYSRSAGSSMEDAEKLAARLGLKTEKIDISPMIDAYYPDIDSADPVRSGNKMARERMSILFDKAHEHNRLVLGTSNRTEICLGYGTWYGDVACSVNPLGMLYKTQVRLMAKYYDVPESILSKIPSADLWPGQTDEGELGLEYDKVDRLLHMMIEQDITKRKKLNEAGFDDAFIDRAVSLLNRFYFKRHLPEIADLGLKPIPDRIAVA
ncbi:MAG: NAD+ synthase [Candidatus Zixiibacteriota bacterium]|nr:MAG: NAD+ synthase [candidate division Zixibacteria bacterium]